MLHFSERCSTVFPFSMELIVFKKSLRKNKLLAQNSPTNIAIWRQNSNIIIVKVKYFCVCVLTISFSIFIFGPKFGKHFYIFLRRTLWSLWEKNELFLRKQILSSHLSGQGSNCVILSFGLYNWFWDGIRFCVVYFYP